MDKIREYRMKMEWIIDRLSTVVRPKFLLLRNQVSGLKHQGENFRTLPYSTSVSYLTLTFQRSPLQIMKISVEISMYPLNENFGQPILNFIKKIKSNANLSVKTNSMSTQIFGKYDDVMTALKNEMEPIFAEEMKTVMVMKIINADLDYNFE